MSDREVLHGFFFASRYITKSVRDRYGLNPALYEVTPDRYKMKMLNNRLSEYIQEHDNIHIQSCEDLRQILGSGFDWINFKIEVC